MMMVKMFPCGVLEKRRYFAHFFDFCFQKIKKFQAALMIFW